MEIIRPCFLVIDREFPGSISTRKLVIETAKFNVLTAYSGREALAMMQRFPAIDGVVMDGQLADMSAEDLTKGLKTLAPKLPVFVMGASAFDHCPSADVTLESFQPQKLLDALRKLKPREAQRIAEHDENISMEQLN